MPRTQILIIIAFNAWLLGTFIGPIWLQWLTRAVAGFTPSYWTAWFAAFLSNCAQIPIWLFCPELLLANKGDPLDPVAITLLVLSGVPLSSLICGRLLKRPGGEPIGFGMASGIVLIAVAFGAIMVGLIRFALWCSSNRNTFCQFITAAITFVVISLILWILKERCSRNATQ
jgi:hypothetical protein